MTAEARPVARPLRPGGFDPLRWAWQLLTNVKFALVLVGTAALLGLLGVVIPQVPGPMRGNAAAKSAWLELRRNDFGPFTGLMDRAGLFDVFHTTWFNGLWLLIIVAVTVCTVSRFQPTWRSVQRPTKRVGDAYFAGAHHRASFTHTGGAEAVEALLKKRRFRVERTHEAGGATFFFAERFAWSQYGTFLSHLALLMLLIGGLLTKLAGFDRTFVLAETTPAAPVFDAPGPGQLFVRMVDASRGKDAAGNVIDFHSVVELRKGDRVVTCTTTVNDPCSAFGYRVHQAAFFDDIARLRIAAPDGRLLYDDVLDFDSESVAVPRLRVTDGSGATLFDQDLPQMDTDPGASPGREDDLAVAVLAFPRAADAAANDLVSYAVSWHVVAGKLRVAISGENLAPRELDLKNAVTDRGYRIEYVDARSIPAIRVGDMPGAQTTDGGVAVQMPRDGNGRPYLFVTGVDADSVVLEAGRPVRASTGYTYTFGGQVEASGVSVRRDPGDTFIWVAVAMAMVGLAITFYVPRRRLWVKVTESRTYLAGVAERSTRFSRELRMMGAELGARDALEPGDLDAES